MASEETKTEDTTDSGEQMSMDDILAAEQPAPEPGSPQAEMMGLDEREARAESQQAEQEPAAETEPAPEPEAKPDDVSDLPKFLHTRPEDAKNWRTLRGIARERGDQVSALQTEKAKLEAELAAARAQAQQQVAQPAEPARPPVSYAEDPEAYVQALRAEQQQAIESARFDMSEAMAVQQHGQEKVNAAFSEFQKLAAAEPALAAQMRAAQHPWGFVVGEIDRRAALAEMGDPATYRERIEAELREQVRAELLAETEAKRSAEVESAIRQRLPTSLAGTPGSGQNATDNGWNGPAPMGQIIDSGLDR